MKRVSTSGEMKVCHRTPTSMKYMKYSSKFGTLEN